MKIAPSLPDAVDVGRFADHQAAMVDARLHPADVIAHDEHDVGLLLLRRGRYTCCHQVNDTNSPTQILLVVIMVGSSCSPPVCDPSVATSRTILWTIRDGQATAKKGCAAQRKLDRYAAVGHERPISDVHVMSV